MKNIKVVALPIVSIFIATSLLAGCTGAVASETSSTESATTEIQVASESVSTQSQDASSTKNNSLIKHHSTEHTYEHGKDGYYNLLENGVEFELTSQLSGTCWICASACAMMTAYQLKHDGKIELDQMDLLNEIYSDDKKEGIFAVEGAATKLSNEIYTGITSAQGQSFILIDGKWLDLSIKDTWYVLGCETNNACIKALYSS